MGTPLLVTYKDRFEKYRKTHLEDVRAQQSKYLSLHPDRIKETKRKYRRNHLQEILEKERSYWRENRERILARRRELYAINSKQLLDKHRKQRYGLSSEAFRNLIESQRGLCSSCGEPFTKTPHVDHNHTTGAVRALLCGNCNRCIGMCDDSPEKLRMMAQYLERFIGGTDG